MDITVVTQIISNVGFPIACVVGMACYIKEQQKTHKEEVKELSSAVTNNTLVLQKLVDLLDRKE